VAIKKRRKMFLSRKNHLRIAVCVCSLMSVPLAAQNNPDGDIVVTATRIKGSVDTDVPPVQEIDEKDIASYGASSITDLVAAVAPQTSSGRGRGGGQPVILLNGQRVSGFRELRDLPPEAIKRVQIFPEELALQYGYRADQRVINFILKDNFASFSPEFENGMPEKGGYSTRKIESTLTRIGASSRLNIDVEYETGSRLTEDERGIIASSSAFTTAQGSSNIGQYRTLLPDTEWFEVNGTWSTVLAPQTNLSLNANYQLSGSRSLLGLPSASLFVPSSSPFSQSGTDTTLNRYFTNPGALKRDSTIGTAQFGMTFNTLLAGWKMAFTGDFSRVDNAVKTTRNADFTDLRAAVIAGTTNPYTTDFGSNLFFASPDLSDSLNQTLTLLNTFTGTPFRIPAGDVKMTLRTGFTRQTLNSQSSGPLSATAALKRNDLNGAINLEVPLIKRGVGVLGFLGDIGINGNYGLSTLSDFGTLREYGAGLRWSPAKGVTMQASLIGDENAPDIAQLGNPVLVTPGVATFDFSTGQSLFVDLISGGNAALRGEKRRDVKLSLNWSPAKIDGLGIQIEYFRNSSSNTTASFPILTPKIEAAFPGRVTRDTSGRLVSIDQRAVNFDRERSQSIRWGFNYAGSIGPQPAGGRGDGRGFGSGTGMPGMPGGAPPSRWQVALYHTYRIQQDILIRPGVPLLDLLNGSAISTLGGAARNEFELSGGVFVKGLGVRVNGTYRGGTRANGTGLPGTSDLRFSDLATLNTVFFVNLDSRGKLTKALPFLKGGRISFRIDNILNDIVDVRDQNGLVPLSYQPGYLDPKGRFFELSFRKRF
jgi:iron complex outermembrane recepter protein